MIAFNVADATAMDFLGANLGRALTTGAVVYLHGELGAGKTTLVRGVLRGLGFTGHVRSPTYTLVEGYEFAARRLYHLDLYRIRGAEELEYLGVRDLDDPDLWVFAEWPERGEGRLPTSDLVLNFDVQEPGRRVRAEPHGRRGQDLVQSWKRVQRLEPISSQ